MIDSLGGRKAVIAVLIVALGVGAVLIKGDIPANFQHLLEVVFGTFVIGNVSTTVSAHVTGVADSTTPASTATVESAPANAQDEWRATQAVDLSPVVADLQAIKAQNETIAQALTTSQQGIGFLCNYVGQQMGAPAATQAAVNRNVAQSI